jgi:hypothetical protein
MKPKFVAQINTDKPGAPNMDEWSDIYDAAQALLDKLGTLTWQDRELGLKEYLRLNDALEARGTKEFKPL